MDSIEYINPDSLNGLNLYAYCNNNPIMNVDPSGNFFLLGFIIGTIIGAAVGFGAVTYLDYQDDGEIFNGSIAWQAYLGATLLGGAVGGILGGYVLPAFSHMSFSIPTGLKLLVDTAGFSHVVVTSAITITGGQVIAGAGTLAALGGLTYMFSKNAKRFKPKDNRANHVQNKEFKRICDEYGLNDSQRDRLHHIISKKGYTIEEIRELIERLFPNMFGK